MHCKTRRIPTRVERRGCTVSGGGAVNAGCRRRGYGVRFMDGLLAGSQAGSRLRSLALLATLLTVLSSILLAGPVLGQRALAAADWTTYHHDAGRSGVDPEPGKPVTPTLSWQSSELGAPIWGQPLVVGSRVYVATVGDEIYALDTATGAVIWKASAGTPVPHEDVICGDIDPTVGIVGTPVIDPVSGRLFAVADTWDAGTKTIHHVLEGFALSNGERVMSVVVDPPGAEPKTLLERPALNISQGQVVFGFGGNAGDCGSYSGAVASVPETGGEVHFWRYSPAAPAYGGAAVWGPSGPSVDSEGHIYVSTGNPNFPSGQEVTTYDYSDSVIELTPAMSLIGSFAPETWLSDSNHDRDLGSAGPELLPGGLFFQAGKNEMGYLVEEAGMGSAAHAVYAEKVCHGAKEGTGEGSFGGDAYSAGTIYVPCVDGVRALSYDQANRRFAPLWHGPAEATGPPIVAGGLVWVLSGKFLAGGGTKLYGLDPATGVPRYTETLPRAVIDHFGSPSAGGGKVFAATGATVTAYQVSEAYLPPTVVTQGPSSVAPTTATLNASVNPNNATVTDCRFEYGPTAAYGASAPCGSLPPSEEAPAAVSAQLSGLTPATTYHYRSLATNAGGTSYGGDQTLVTASPPGSAPPGGTPTSQTSAPSLVTEVPQQGVLPFHEAAPPAPGPALLSSSLSASAAGTISLRVACARVSRCVGTLTLRTLSAHGGGRARPTTLAVAGFDIPGGRVASVKLRLSATARRLLARMHVLGVQARIVWHAPGGPANAVQDTLRLRLASSRH